ncbi:MAG: galactose-1-phosphate uridylyltransferase [Terriglobia bacterium]
MSEFRKDPITGRWVIIATDRSKRPTDFPGTSVRTKGGFCPFCYGNESHTPPEIMSYRPDGSAHDSPGWMLRVVPNKFPALRVEGNLNRQGEGIFDKMDGVGAHEVIIETPDHNAKLSTLSEQGVQDVLWAFRDRMLDLKKDKRLRYILIFKNHGEDAGASLEHSHSQLIALPIIPNLVREEIEGSKVHYAFKERCVYCDIIRQELNSGDRVIDENQDFVVIAPYAPRFTFETWILPKTHDASFEDAQKREYESLARILRSTLQKVDHVLNQPAYNLVIHTSPLTEPVSNFYHWHIEIMPKLSKIAGFEWGSGFYINPVPPEDSARFLREAQALPLSSEARLVGS